MDARLLTQLDSTDGVRRLFTALGYDPAGDDSSVPCTIARWKHFRVVAATDRAPRERARAEARRLSRAGACAMVAVLDPGRELVLAVPMPTASGTSRLLIVDLERPDRTTRRLLDDLRPNGASSALAHAIRVGNLLSTEAAGERFFAAFRTMVERLAGSLDRRHSLADRRLVTLIALMRILFLYFVQEKGWLDGRRDFLVTLLDDALTRGRDFHRRCLEPLFFGTLNRPVADRSEHMPFGAVPYLNGGLFEPHSAERRVATRFTNAQWRDAFDELFERFRFCVHEGDDVDAVAPDMLGRVFERLMAPEDRLDTGTYYTPETVVRQIVDSAVETALARLAGLDEAGAARLVRHRELHPRDRPRAARGFKALTVLDPAAGSGAFLLGALESLTAIHGCITDGVGPEARTRSRRHVLRHHLFGVDVNPVAVRLAELRLWLAVVAEDPAESIHDVAPLPNLNGIVRQGDSLLDPLADVVRGARPTPELRAARDAVQADRQRVFAAHGRGRTRALSAHRRSERALAGILLGDAIVRLEREIRDLSAAEPPRDLFGAVPNPTTQIRDHLRLAQRRRSELAKALRELEDGATPFFSFDVHIPETMARGGFSVVVGNPPWVRAERLSAERRAVLRDRFAWWRGDGGRGYQHLPDLAVAFLERALELAAPGGAVGMLLPSKIVSAGYGERTRFHLVSETRIAYLHRVPDREAERFGATTYPLAMVLEKRAPPADAMVRLQFDGPPVLRQAQLKQSGPWILVPDRQREALDEFRASGTPLAAIIPPALGLKTGADDVFVGTLLDQHGALARMRFQDGDVTIERCMLRPTLRARDVHAFRAMPTRWMLWTHDQAGRPRTSLPRHAGDYMSGNHSRLIARADYKSAKPWCVFRVAPAIAPHRVIWRDLTLRPVAVYLDALGPNPALPLNTCYVAAVPDSETAHMLTAVLNSTWTAALVRAVADEARGGYRRMNARVAGTVPVPPASRPLVALSRELHRKGTFRDRDLDDAVAEALGLTSRTRGALRELAAHIG